MSPNVRPSRCLPALLLLAASTAWAQGPNPPPREPYSLGIGDIVEVVVLNEPDFCTIPPGLEIGPDGRIGLPSIGWIVAEGRTCEEAAQLIAQRLRDMKVLLDPQVLVRVSQYRAVKVNVIGAVRMPGSFVHRPGMDVRDAIALAGGLLLDEGTAAASRLRARVIHADGRSEVIKVNDVLEGTGPAPELLPGDTLVFELEATVSVLGYVAHPGFYKVQDGTRLSGAIALAGGVGVGTAGVEVGDLRRVVVNRADGTKLEVDLQRVLSGQGADDPIVSPGDVVYVPQFVQEASILGYVQSPGRYPFRDGDRVTDLLAQAKGALTGAPQGDLTRAVLARSDGTVRTLDLTKSLAGQGTDESNPRLTPGDTVTVPETQNRVIVSGYVKTPGYYDFHPDDTVRSAVGQAGGVIPNSGSESAVRVRHTDGTEVTLDLGKENPPLRPGDDVTVPFTRHKVTVVGYVTSPGLYEWEKGDTVVDMIAAASGPVLSRDTMGFGTEKGNPTRAILARQANGQYEITNLDLARFYKGGDRSQNPEAQPGDIILVPRKAYVDYERILRDILIIPSLVNAFGGRL